MFDKLNLIEAFAKPNGQPKVVSKSLAEIDYHIHVTYVGH